MNASRKPNPASLRECPVCRTGHDYPHCDGATREQVSKRLEELAAERRPAVLEEIDRERRAPSQGRMFPDSSPWTDEDCNILADIDDESFAELFIGDQVAAEGMAACRQISNGQHNHKIKHTLMAFRGVDSPEGQANRERVGRTKRTIVGVTKGVVLALVGGVMSGCAYGNVFASHISHPLVGYPVTANRDELGRSVEGQINAIGISLGKCYGRVCVEQAISYDVTAGCDACLRGGPLLYEGRVSFRLFGGGAQ